jgi:hypothetical protein
MQHHVHATARGIDHGHVIDIGRRLSPWPIEARVTERHGQVEWDLYSNEQTAEEMARELKAAARRSTGRDCVRISHPHEHEHGHEPVHPS